MKRTTITFLLCILWLIACQQPKGKPLAQKVLPAEIGEVPEEITIENDGYEGWPSKHTPKEIERIKRIIRLFKEREIAELATLFRYPIEREIPVPWIKDEKEFVQRFDELFDTAFVNELAKGNMEDWTVGSITRIGYKEYRIYLFDSLIDGVNYQSPKEKILQQALIQKEKENLHPTLRRFEKPIFKVITDNFLIRIDKIKPRLYRYASWKRGASEASRPDLVLQNDSITDMSSGGNHAYPFNNGPYRYVIHRNIVGCETTPPFTFDVEKNGHSLHREGGDFAIQ